MMSKNRLSRAEFFGIGDEEATARSSSSKDLQRTEKVVSAAVAVEAGSVPHRRLNNLCDIGLAGACLGNDVVVVEEQSQGLPVRKPSYIGLSRAVSGYCSSAYQSPEEKSLLRPRSGRSPDQQLQQQQEDPDCARMMSTWHGPQQAIGVSSPGNDGQPPQGGDGGGGGSLVRKQIERLYGGRIIPIKVATSPEAESARLPAAQANSGIGSNGDNLRSFSPGANKVPAVFRLLRPEFMNQLKESSCQVDLESGGNLLSSSERIVPIRRVAATSAAVASNPSSRLVRPGGASKSAVSGGGRERVVPIVVTTTIDSASNVSTNRQPGPNANAGANGANGGDGHHWQQQQKQQQQHQYFVSSLRNGGSAPDKVVKPFVSRQSSTASAKSVVVAPRVMGLSRTPRSGAVVAVEAKKRQQPRDDPTSGTDSRVGKTGAKSTEGSPATFKSSSVEIGPETERPAEPGGGVVTAAGPVDSSPVEQHQSDEEDDDDEPRSFGRDQVDDVHQAAAASLPDHPVHNNVSSPLQSAFEGHEDDFEDDEEDGGNEDDDDEEAMGEFRGKRERSLLCPILEEDLAEQQQTVQEQVVVIPSNREVLQGGMAVIAEESEQRSEPEEGGAATLLLNAEDDEGLRDGHFFIKVLENEIFTFEEKICDFEEDLATSGDRIPEEIKDSILAAVGKARLLTNQKLAQFRGLCEKNITSDPADPFVPKSKDLEGFWDMVYIQVQHIHTLFAELGEIKANGWKVVHQPPPVLPKSASPSAGRKLKQASLSSKNGRSTKSSMSKVEGNGDVGPGSKGPQARTVDRAKARDEARRRMMEHKKKLMMSKKANDEQKADNDGEEALVVFIEKSSSSTNNNNNNNKNNRNGNSCDEGEAHVLIPL